MFTDSHMVRHLLKTGNPNLDHQCINKVKEIYKLLKLTFLQKSHESVTRIWNYVISNIENCYTMDNRLWNELTHKNLYWNEFCSVESRVYFDPGNLEKNCFTPWRFSTDTGLQLCFLFNVLQCPQVSLFPPHCLTLHNMRFIRLGNRVILTCLLK